MADLTIRPNLQALTPLQPGRTEAIKAAQRAFFNAALTEAQATAPVRPLGSQATVSAQSATRPNVVNTDTAPADRVLRPGSLLDIRV